MNFLARSLPIAMAVAAGATAIFAGVFAACKWAGIFD